MYNCNNYSKNDSNKINCFEYETASSLLLNSRRNNFIILNSFMSIIKRKYLLLCFSLFKMNINSQKINVFKNCKSNSEINIKIFCKKSIQNKFEEISEYHKIKVIKNNNIAKIKRIQLIKKIMGKKLNDNIKKNIFYLRKFFYIWKKHRFNKSATFTHFHPNNKLYKANNIDNLN